MNKIVITKSGFNALTETDPNNMIFSSDYGTLKYDISGNTTVTVPSGTPVASEFVIATHNLGYVPFFTGFIKELALEQYYNLPYTFADFGGNIYFFLYATTTQLILRTELSTNASSFDITVWYKVFKNRIDS